MIPGTSRGLTALQLCWKSHFEAAMEIDLPNTEKARRTAQSHTEPIDIPKPTTGLYTAFQRQDPTPSTRTQAQALPTRETSQDSNQTPSIGADSTTKNYDLENHFFNFFPFFFFLIFSLINHTVYSPYLLAFCGAVEFPLCVSCQKQARKKLILVFFFFLSHIFFFFLDEFMDFVLDMFNCFSYCSLLAVNIPEYTLIFSTHVYSSLLFYFFFSLFKFFNPLCHPFLFSLPSLHLFLFSLFLFSLFSFTLFFFHQVS